MDGSDILFYLIGAVALLVFGVRQVRYGVTHAFGSYLRRIVEKGTKSPLRGFTAGLVVTGIVQSSTATALLLTSFASRGIITVGAALAVMLGADVGTTLIAQILSLDVHWLAPIFLAIGVIGCARGQKTRSYYIFSAIVGLGLMLIALDMIVRYSLPMKESVVLLKVMSALSNDTVLLFLITTGLTALSHSSLATVLLVMSLAAGDVLGLEPALVAVLGANVGGALPPLIMNLKEGGNGRVVAFGTFVMRLTGAILCFVLFPVLLSYQSFLGELPARQVVNFHTFFNLSKGLLFLPLTGFFAMVIIKILPFVTEQTEDESQLKYLDESALKVPEVALPLAKREVLRMGDQVQSMLGNVITLFYGNDHRALLDIRRQDDSVDRLYERIKVYLSKMSQGEMTEEQSEECQAILIFATNLEHIGDIIDKNLCDMGQKRLREGLMLSDEGIQEIIDFHGQVMTNFRLGMNLFMSNDAGIALKIVRNKDTLQEAASETTTQHFDRMRMEVDKTLNTSSLHLDIIRDLRRVNSYMAHHAYTILEKSGDLQSRIKP